jgi:hypothetical protein
MDCSLITSMACLIAVTSTDQAPNFAPQDNAHLMAKHEYRVDGWRIIYDMQRDHVARFRFTTPAFKQALEDMRELGQHDAKVIDQLGKQEHMLKNKILDIQRQLQKPAQ